MLHGNPPFYIRLVSRLNSLGIIFQLPFWIITLSVCFVTTLGASSSSDELKNVCDRTIQVRDAILELLPTINDCRDVTAPSLEELSYLNLERMGIGRLEAGDFDGMVNLIDLHLRDNVIRELPVGIFEDLPKIETINLRNNLISSIESGAFADLPKLHSLNLSNNKLAEISVAYFSNIPTLTLLDVSGNELSYISTSVIETLPNLSRLGIDYQYLSALSSEILNVIHPDLEVKSEEVETGRADAVYLHIDRALARVSETSRAVRSIPVEIAEPASDETASAAQDDVEELVGAADDGMAMVTEEYDAAAPMAREEADTMATADDGMAMVTEEDDATATMATEEADTMEIADATAMAMEENGAAAAMAAPEASYVQMVEEEMMAEEKVAPDEEKGGIVGDVEISTSRLFSTIAEYPPRMFAAYGIVAFRSGVTDSSRSSYMAICQGYIAALASSVEVEDRLGVPAEGQLATVWPLKTTGLSEGLNQLANLDDDDVCEEIVDDTSIVMSKVALNAAKKQTEEAFDRRGPYLLAWSPSAAFHEEDALVLYLDLSDVRNDEQAVDMFNFWKDEIEKDPKVWYEGWNLERLRIKMRLFADRFGQNIFGFFATLFD